MPKANDITILPRIQDLPDEGDTKTMNVTGGDVKTMPERPSYSTAGTPLLCPLNPSHWFLPEDTLTRAKVVCLQSV